MLIKSVSKNGYTFAIVYSSKCVTVFLKQTLVTVSKKGEGGSRGLRGILELLVLKRLHRSLKSI